MDSLTETNETTLVWLTYLIFKNTSYQVHVNWISCFQRRMSEVREYFGDFIPQTETTCFACLTQIQINSHSISTFLDKISAEPSYFLQADHKCLTNTLKNLVRWFSNDIIFVMHYGHLNCNNLESPLSVYLDKKTSFKRRNQKLDQSYLPCLILRDAYQLTIRSPKTLELSPFATNN